MFKNNYPKITLVRTRMTCKRGNKNGIMKVVMKVVLKVMMKEMMKEVMIVVFMMSEGFW